MKDQFSERTVAGIRLRLSYAPSRTPLHDIHLGALELFKNSSEENLFLPKLKLPLLQDADTFKKIESIFALQDDQEFARSLIEFLENTNNDSYTYHDLFSLVIEVAIAANLEKKIIAGYQEKLKNTPEAIEQNRQRRPDHGFNFKFDHPQDRKHSRGDDDTQVNLKDVIKKRAL